MASFGGRVTIDLGTGDGRLPWVSARASSDRLFVGVDASAAGLREISGRAHRSHLANVLYVRAAVENLPLDLAGVADQVTVVLPWGSLLAAVARPVAPLLSNIRALCQTHAILTVLLAMDAERDRTEHARLGLPMLDANHLAGTLPEGYAEAGLRVTSVRRLETQELRAWPSTWSLKLAHGRPRQVFRIDATAERSQPGHP